MTIAVIGLGYVGLANALFLGRGHRVFGYDIDAAKVAKLKHGQSSISDRSIDAFIKANGVTFHPTSILAEAIEGAEIVVVAIPTDYDASKDRLSIDALIASLRDIVAINNKALIVIRSTVPIGTTDELTKRFGPTRIAYMPEFLREGSALTDTLAPYRLVIGAYDDDTATLEAVYKTEHQDIPIIKTTPAEAEAIKLLANSYLALRVAFFNELDDLSLHFGMDTRKIIEALGFDPRIGLRYNNPSFGFSGYCLPKDVKQLNKQFDGRPHHLIKAILDSNRARIETIVDAIIARKPNVVGIYRLVSKADSDDFRHAVILEVIAGLKRRHIPLIVYEPLLKDKTYDRMAVVADIEEFVSMSALVVANRADEKITKLAKDKLFTRDVFNSDK